MLRTTILRGPAVVQFGGQTFYSKGDIKCDISMETFSVETSAFGISDKRRKERIAKVSFEPAGAFTSAVVAVLMPYAAMAIGTSIFGSSDSPLVIWTLDGKKVTFLAAAVTKVPDLILSAVKSMWGNVEFTCLGGGSDANLDWTTASSFVAVTTASFTDASFAVADIITQPYAAAWGSSPWDAFKTAEGFVISQNVNLAPLVIDSTGNIDFTFGSLEVMAKCRPVGISEAQLIAALGIQGTGFARGGSLAAGATNLVITGGTTPKLVTVTINKANIETAGFEFGATTLRVGEVGFVATRTIESGSLPALVVAGLS